jgi:N-acyl-D-aspartate/D-glutamate deacylase
MHKKRSGQALTGLLLALAGTVGCELVGLSAVSMHQRARTILLPGAARAHPERLLAAQPTGQQPNSKASATQPSDSVGAQFDLVIRNGRVIDPETRSDQTGINVGVRNGTIAAVTSAPLSGRREIDATGLIVAPGFIDLLSYDPNSPGVWTKIADGVTTNLAMHGGASNPVAWYARYERRPPPLHFGASFFYSEARNRFHLSRYQPATKKQIEELVAIAEKALKNGALGISFSLEYVPGITRDEILPLMHLAKRYDVPVFFHARYSTMEGPGTNLDALEEIIGYARQTRAAVHIEHINSTGGTFSMAQSLKMLQAARSEGLDITACTYPYNFWGAYLNSARLDKGWQKRFRITYGDLQLAGTTERLTEESFRRYRHEGKLAVAYAIPEEDVVAALQCPFVMIGSDGILEPSNNNHPRASGTFARTLGVYAREKKTLTLMDALAKMTIQPARRMEKSASAFKKKGRLSVGADADIVIFNYDKIIDRATVEHPEYPSAGIEYVLVRGAVAKTPTGVNKRVRAGQALKRD